MKSNFIKLKCDFDTFYLSINQRFITTEPKFFKYSYKQFKNSENLSILLWIN